MVFIVVRAIKLKMCDMSFTYSPSISTFSEHAYCSCLTIVGLMVPIQYKPSTYCIPISFVYVQTVQHLSHTEHINSSVEANDS